MPLMTSFSSLSHPNFLPRRGFVNSPNQWKSLEARSRLLRGLWSNSHLNSRNIASWHKDQSNSGVVFLSAAAQPILHKPSSFQISSWINLCKFPWLKPDYFPNSTYAVRLSPSSRLFSKLIFVWIMAVVIALHVPKTSIHCKTAQQATNNWYVRSRVPIMQLEPLSRLWWF